MADFSSPQYKSLLERWSKPVLDTLDEIDSLPNDSVTANVEGIIAEILFNLDLTKVGGRDLDAYGKAPPFSEFYARFKQTGLYRDMEQVRQAQIEKSAR